MRQLWFLAAALLLMLVILWRDGHAVPQQDVSVIAAERTELEEIPALRASDAALAIQRTELKNLFPAAETFPEGLAADATGDCVLELRFFDEKTWQPVSGSAQLWRLDLPEDARWTSGDYLQLEGEVVNGVWQVENLPPGRYRVFAMFARYGSDSPASFEMKKGHNMIEWHVPMPQEEDVFLQMHRIDGSVIDGHGRDMVEIVNRSSTIPNVQYPTPAWVTERQKKNGGFIISCGGGSGGHYASRSSRKRWIETETSEFGFYFDTIKEDDRQNRTEHHRTFRVNQGHEIKLSVTAEGAGRYVVPYVSLDQLQAKLRFPIGEAEEDFRDRFRIVAYAAPVGIDGNGKRDYSQTSAQAFRESSILVRLDSTKYKYVHFAWSPADGDLPEIQLELQRP